MSSSRAREGAPEMLELGRKARGLSQTELAKRMGVSQPRVSGMETGIRPFTYEFVESAADALSFPPGFFFQDRPQRFIDSVPFHHRKLRSVGATKIAQTHAQLTIMQMHIALLVQEHACKTHEGIREYDPDVGPDEVAQRVRVAWAIQDGPISHLVNLIEGAGAVVQQCDLGAIRIDGLSRHVPGQHPIIFLNRKAPGDRQRWTLAHELGHLLMHVGCGPTEAIELEADRFAAELLMPARLMGRDFALGLDISRLVALKRKWMVSMQSLVRRAADLGYIDARKKKSLQVQISKRGWRMREPVQIDVEMPRAVRLAIDSLVQDLADTHSAAQAHEAIAAGINFSIEDFQRLYLPERQGLRVLPGDG